MLSEHKVRNLLDREVPSLFIVGFKDALGWVRLVEDHLSTSRYGGRTAQTRDEWDEEDVCHIPRSNFTAAPQDSDGGHMRYSDTEWGPNELTSK
jgi:hypothetical protein